MTLRALVIGAGPATVQMHLPVLAAQRDRGEIELALVCDINGERARTARGKFGFLEDSGDGLTALERADVDVVYIFGSAQLHHQYGLAALRNEKHLFVEKPIAPDYARALALAQAARANGRVAVGGHNRRFYKSLATVRARAGKVGWRFAEAVFHRSELGRPAPFGASTWLGANGIHALDALIFMMGSLPEQLTAIVGETGGAAPHAFSAVMRWRDGAQAVFVCNNAAGARREEYVFHGLGETYSICDEGLTIQKNNTVEKLELPAIGCGIAAEHDSFLHAIRSGDEPPHSIASIAPVLFLATLIENGFSGRVELPTAEVTPRRRPADPAVQSILVTQSNGLHLPLARLLPRHRLVSVQDVRDAAAERPDIVAAILGRGSEPLSADVLAKLPRLAVIGIAGLSLARLDPESLAARGIALVNSSAAYAESVAEFALGLAILGRRRAFVSHENMRRGGWGPRMRTPGIRGGLDRLARSLRPAIRAVGLEALLLSTWRAVQPRDSISGAHIGGPHDLQGAIVGLIGWGANARAFTTRLNAAGARVLVYSEHANGTDISDADATPVSLSNALAADIVSLHRGLNETTRHFLGAPELARLRPGTTLINVARGALIEPNALLARLRQNDIFACLDTFEGEPLATSSPLRNLPNVFLTSHIAGGSTDMHDAAADEVVRKVAAHILGETTESISVDRLRTMS